MEISVNNQKTRVPEEITVEQLLKEKGFSNWVAIWINGKQILQKNYPIYRLKANDKVKIIKPLAGG